MTDRPAPDSLRPGDLVGPWRIEGYAGRGSYGVVFRARRAGHPSSRPVALKMAQCEEDPRFVREVGLLERAADDLYALAVSSYRLLTGAYPPPGMDIEARVSLRALNPRVVRELVDLLERVLAEDPQARGCARERAQAADSAAEHAGPEADVPLFEPQAAAEAAPVWAGPEAHLDRSAAEARRHCLHLLAPGT